MKRKLSTIITIEFIFIAIVSTGGAYSLRVMTYNVRYETSSDGINRWSARKHNVYNLIRKHIPDIIGFQEVL